MIDEEEIVQPVSRTDCLMMTEETIGADLLSALIDEFNLLQNPWQSLSKENQDDVIDRLRLRIKENVHQAVRLLDSDGRVTVAAIIDQITVNKDGIKASLKTPKNISGGTELISSQGLSCLVVIGGAEQYLKGMDEIEGEDEQGSLLIGEEYQDQ